MKVPNRTAKSAGAMHQAVMGPSQGQEISSGASWCSTPGCPAQVLPFAEMANPGWGREPSGSGHPYCLMLEGRTRFLSWLTAGLSLVGRCRVVHGRARALGLLEATPGSANTNISRGKSRMSGWGQELPR